MIKYKRREEIKKLLKKYLQEVELTLYDIYVNPHLEFEDLPEKWQEIISEILSADEESISEE